MAVRLRVRGSLVVAGVVVLVVLTGIGGLLVMQAVRPHISVEEATAAAISRIQQMNTGASGFALVSARYDPSPDRIYDDQGRLIYSHSGWPCSIGGIRAPSFLCHPEPAWILHLRAPAQGGYSVYEAYVTVNATTGRVSSASVAGS